MCIQKKKYVYHYIVEDGTTYLCMADEGFGRAVPFKFLEDMKTRFKQSFGDRARTAHAYAFNNDFQQIIHKLMDQANDPRNMTYRSSDRKINEIHEAIGDTQKTVMEGIEKVIARGEHLELLVHKSDELQDNAFKFNSQAKKLKNQMLWRNVKMGLILFFIILIIVYIILAMVCGWDLHCK